jgi:hypothetical protein
MFLVAPEQGLGRPLAKVVVSWFPPLGPFRTLHMSVGMLTSIFVREVAALAAALAAALGLSPAPLVLVIRP